MVEYIKKYSIFITLIAVNVIVMSAVLMFFRPEFKLVPDQFMIDTLNGNYGIPSSKIIFSNIFWGKLLKTLVVYFPAVSWYSVIYDILLCISFCIITCWALKSSDETSMYMLISFLVIMSIECYGRPSYTKLSVFLVGISYYSLLFKKVRGKAESLFYLVFGIIGGLICLRIYTIFSVLCIAYALIRIVKEKRESKCAEKNYIWFGIIGIVSVSLFYVAETIFYIRKPLWDNFFAEKRYILELMELGIPEYETIHNLINIKLEPAEYGRFLTNGMFSIRGADLLEIVREKHTFHLSIIYAWHFAKRILRELLHTNIGLFVIFLINWSRMSDFIKERKKLTIALLLIGTVLLYWFELSIDSWIGVILILILFLFIIIPEKKLVKLSPRELGFYYGTLGMLIAMNYTVI